MGGSPPEAAMATGDGGEEEPPRGKEAGPHLGSSGDLVRLGKRAGGDSLFLAGLAILGQPEELGWIRPGRLGVGGSGSGWVGGSLSWALQVSEKPPTTTTKKIPQLLLLVFLLEETVEVGGGG